jgi:LytS/YehU family sensor histidine kinase
VVGLLTAVILQMRDERREAQAALLTSARLEVELLKRNIQPHFLMNSLASLMEVIEQSPQGAGPLIESLAGEFRILARVSGEKLISLGQELELCDCHLRVMSMRQGTSWRLERDGVNPDTLVPPALFHTLIENGITHSEGRPQHRVFRLRAEVDGDVTRFTLLAPVARPPEEATAPSPVNGRRPEALNGSATGGTGLRYVKARLEESFPGRWQLRTGLTSEGWQTAIEIRHSR